MPVKIPVKALFREDGVVDALGEFVAGDYISVDDGGPGTVSFTTNEVLIGNGTNALSTVSRNNIVAGSSKITINGGSSASGVVLGSNVTVDVVEDQIDIAKCKGVLSFSKVTDTPEGFWERAEIGGGAADSEGNQVKDGGTM